MICLTLLLDCTWVPFTSPTISVHFPVSSGVGLLILIPHDVRELVMVILVSSGQFLDWVSPPAMLQSISCRENCSLTKFKKKNFTYHFTACCVRLTNIHRIEVLELAEGELCVNVALELYHSVGLCRGLWILYSSRSHCAALQLKCLPWFQMGWWSDLAEWRLDL